ncbi:MAG: hypothetical protein D6B27_09815 [Gammaproteobacteria bacterium]|nr:MAG: hypothetical protein D6B27_09815 [Gammaproteobacteria bacterium]
MKNTIYKIAVAMLKPLVRIMIKHDISYSELSNVLKHVYVDVAENDFALDGKKQTNSRISVLTGIHRKEVLRIKNEPLEVLKEKKEKGSASRIINGWVTDSDYLGNNNEPLVIPKKGERPSFSDLVNRYGADTPPGAILDEMVRLGLAEVTDDEAVHLLSKVYIPYKDIEQKLLIASRAVSNLLLTIDYNLECEDDNSRLQLSVTYDDVPQDVANVFRELSLRKSMDLLNLLNEWLNEREKNHKNEVADGKNVGLGIYYFEN